MTPEQMRIALAKELGWIRTTSGDGWFNPNQNMMPHYLTDANAAIEIVEMMRERGWDLHLANERATWDAAFVHRSLFTRWEASSQILPLAICEAACRAVGLF